MKKASVIFLSLLFLLSTVGLTINTHFCSMLNKSETTVFTKKSCCAGKEEKGGCCHNETKIIKITDNYSPSQSINLSPSFSFLAIPQFASNLLDVFTFNNTRTFYLNIRPPLLHQGVSLSVLYRSILI
jgi:hypothetical protein